MNGAFKIRSTVAGILFVGSFAVLPTQGLAGDVGKSGSEWLSIGIPSYLQDDKGGRSGGANDDGRSLFSTHYDIGRFSVRDGRVDPSFGLAWDKTTGFYGTNMTGDPASSDFLSLSTGLQFNPPGWGSHSLSSQTVRPGGTPQRDGFLGSSLDRPPTPGSADGGDASASFNLVLEGGRFPVLPDLAYHFAIINQSDGGVTDEKEKGFAAGLTTKFDIGPGLSMSPMIEAARLSDPVGTRERERQYWSTSMLTEWRNWNLGLTYSQRETEDPAAAAIREYRAQASVGYVFDFGLSADLGWYRQKEEDESTDQFGFRFTYPFRIGK